MAIKIIAANNLHDAYLSHKGYGKTDSVCVCVLAVTAQRLQCDEN